MLARIAGKPCSSQRRVVATMTASLVTNMTTCFSASSPAVATRKATVTLSASSPPVARLITTLSFLAIRLFQQFADGGGELYVCPICFNVRKLDQQALVGNAKLSGATALWQFIGEGATVFSY